ncbi:MAG TPA: hypothetical protein DGG95_15395 [Cytophagales bacterium]|jgi:hypothetical protein|nr:hypothetical protein [Cytophagales bacterium]
MRFIFPLVLLIVVHSNVKAQGCSDAGFCTMGAMKPDQPYNKRIAVKLRSMEISFYRGETTLTPIVYVATADMNFSLNRKNSFQIKVPFQHVDGHLASTSSLSDLSLCFTRNFVSSDKFDLNFSLGGKIPTNNSNMSAPDGNALPMYYQTSLGTWDAISGISLINRHWLIATGIQIPLNQNKNQFDWHRWDNGQPDDSVQFAYVKRYPNATNLKRGIDIMLRIERNFRFSRFNFSVGLLPIYRITPDVITNAKGVRTSYDLQGNKAMGLAMSWITTAGYSFSVRSAIKLLVGHKITQRNFSPDGLTREWVSSITYIYRF